MRGIASPLAMKVNGRVGGIIQRRLVGPVLRLGPEAFEARPGFNECRRS
jgi:hypothetical protein